jgi:hypothetical protein
MPRGQVILENYQQRILDERLAQHILARCAKCDWTAEGTLAETSQLALEHRTAQHPELKQSKAQLRRTRPGAIRVSPTTLADNIDAARKQGAATWA